MKRVRFRDLSINTKFVMSLCLILIIPLIILFAFINTNETQELEQQACRTVLETLKQAKTPLYSMVNDADYLSKEILAQASVQEYLRQCTQKPLDELYEYRYKVDLAEGIDWQAFGIDTVLTAENGVDAYEKAAHISQKSSSQTYVCRA